MTTVRPTSDIVSDLLEAAAIGGGTVPAVVGQLVPTNGYAVGGRVPSVIVPADEVIRTDIIHFVRDNLTTAAFHGSFFGAWVERGELFLDVTDVFGERHTAMSLASYRGELAIWDLRASANIMIEGA